MERAKKIKIVVGIGVLAVLVIGGIFAYKKFFGKGKEAGEDGEADGETGGTGGGVVAKTTDGTDSEGNTVTCKAAKRTGKSKTINGNLVFEMSSGTEYNASLEKCVDVPAYFVDAKGSPVNPITGLAIKAGEGKG